MHRTPNNSPRSSVIHETRPLIQQQPSRSCVIPLILSAGLGVIVAGVLKTSVFNPGICGASSSLHLDTTTEQLGASFAGGLVTTAVGTIVGYFCQTKPEEVALAAPINHDEARSAEVAAAAAADAF